MQPNNPIVGGTVLRIPAIQSPNYIAGTSGWAIFQDGTAEFNNVTVRGTFETGTDPGAHVKITGGQILIYDSTNTLVGQLDQNGIEALGSNGSIASLFTLAGQAQAGFLPGGGNVNAGQVIGEMSGSVPELLLSSPQQTLTSPNDRAFCILSGATNALDSNAALVATIVGLSGASAVNMTTPQVELNSNRAFLTTFEENFPLTANLVLTGVNQPVKFGASLPSGVTPNATTGIITVTTISANARWSVDVWIDAQVNTAGDTIVADLSVDGSIVNGEPIEAVAGATGRATVSQGYNDKFASAGNHTFQLLARRAAGAGVADQVGLTHTKMRIVLKE